MPSRRTAAVSTRTSRCERSCTWPRYSRRRRRKMSETTFDPETGEIVTWEAPKADSSIPESPPLNDPPSSPAEKTATYVVLRHLSPEDLWQNLGPFVAERPEEARRIAS